MPLSMSMKYVLDKLEINHHREILISSIGEWDRKYKVTIFISSNVTVHILPDMKNYT